MKLLAEQFPTLQSVTNQKLDDLHTAIDQRLGPLEVAARRLHSTSP